MGKLQRIALIAVVMVLVLTIAGCATLFKGSTENVSFASDPEKAAVFINGTYFGDTPFELNLQSNDNYTVEFRKDGYTGKTVLINNKVGIGWVVLDIFTGFVPVVIDAITGDWKYLDTTDVNAALEKL